MRFLLIAVVLALLAVAGPRHDGKASKGVRHGSPTGHGQLATQPAPEPLPSAIVSAVVTPSGAVHTHLAAESRRHQRPAPCSVAVGPDLSSVPRGMGPSRFLPLLI